MVVFQFPIRVRLERRPWPAKLTHKGSLTEITGTVVGMGFGELSSKEAPGPIPRQKSNLFALTELHYAAMNSGLLVFELPGHQKE